MTETPELELGLDFDLDGLTDFFRTLTPPELSSAMELGLTMDDDAGVDVGEMISVLGVMAARRLGHRQITNADIASIPLAQTMELIAKASNTAANQNQRTKDLLAELSGEAERP